MGDKIFECVWKNKDERNAALNEISNLGKSIAEMAEEGDYICNPIDERGYQACVYNFLKLLPPMSVENMSKYKKLILDERWKLKNNRCDELIDMGVGEREKLTIGLSAEAVNYIFDEYFWQEYNENEDFITDDVNDLNSYSNEPVLVVEHSQRAEHIEKVLDERNVTLDSIQIGTESDAVTLIEDTREKRNCSICEAIVESVFILLEAWCNKE